MQKILSDYKRLNFILWLILSLFLILYKFSFHELWKDEWQAWMVARDLGFANMFSFLNYEGHPSLWYFYLKIWSFLPLEDHISLQLSHSILAVSTLYFVFLKVRIPSLWKLLFALSYFMVFEYGVINRGYVLVILLSLISIHLILNKSRNWFIGITLFLLCQTEAYGVIIAGGITLYLLLDQSGKRIIFNNKLILWSISGLIFFIFTVYPRGNKDDFTRAYNQQSLSFEVVHESIQGHLANVFTIGMIEDTASKGITLMGLIISLFVLGIIVWIFIRDRRTLITFLFGLLAFIIFGILIFSGGIRQWGMVYIFFFLVLIIYHSRNSIWLPTRSILVTLLMIAPMLHGIKALITDYKIPFSNAESTGLFIKEKVPFNVPVVVINKFETAPVGAYAGRAFYELPSGEKFTYFKWLEKVYIPTQSELVLFTKFKKVGGIVILSPSPIDSKRFPNAILWKEFSEENFKRENYWLYSLPTLN